MRVPLPLRGGLEPVRFFFFFAARRPFQRDKSLINAVDRLDVIKFPLVRGFRLRNRSPTAGETSLGGDPILLSSPLSFTLDPHRWIFSRRGRRIVPLTDPIDLRIPVFLVRLFSRSFTFEKKRVRRNWFEGGID